jgi:hypothetical protein
MVSHNSTSYPVLAVIQAFAITDPQEREILWLWGGAMADRAWRRPLAIPLGFQLNQRLPDGTTLSLGSDGEQIRLAGLRNRALKAFGDYTVIGSRPWMIRKMLTANVERAVEAAKERAQSQ